MKKARIVWELPILDIIAVILAFASLMVTLMLTHHVRKHLPLAGGCCSNKEDTADKISFYADPGLFLGRPSSDSSDKDQNFDGARPQTFSYGGTCTNQPFDKHQSW